uniref:Uncharacterized protein n=1 Tax=Rhizophora mucronata TaxID=61149 RepID=A0A2P2NT14_RHIMU
MDDNIWQINTKQKVIKQIM